MLKDASELLQKVDISAYSKQLEEVQSESDKLLNSQGYSSPEYIASLKKISFINEVISKHKLIEKLVKDIKDTQELLSNEELKEIAEEDIIKNEAILKEELSQLIALTRKKLPNDDNKAIFEIRPGVGGVEASLFAESLFKMYINYCSGHKFKVEMYSLEYNEEGGINEATFLIDEDGAFGKFRFESGVHRVQRVPTTEAAGRIHTSTVAVAVLPQFEQSEIKLDEKDLRIDVYRSSGPGGQSVNTTDSAVRVTHIPTGMIVTSQNSRSQIKNKELAISILFAKLQEIEMQKQMEAEMSIRKEAVATSDRSMKIRTYNFPQSRVTDHRVNYSWFNIEEIVAGQIDEVLQIENTELRKDQPSA